MGTMMWAGGRPSTSRMASFVRVVRDTAHRILGCDDQQVRPFLYPQITVFWSGGGVGVADVDFPLQHLGDIDVIGLEVDTGRCRCLHHLVHAAR